MQFFFRNCTHILTRIQGEKFEDMFLVKIASKGTSLRIKTFFSCLTEAVKVSSQSRKSEFRVFSIVHFNIYNF